jgi:transposase-like protein
MTAPIVFSSIGHGLSVAGQYVELAGERYWVAFLAVAEGARRHERITAQRRTWRIRAQVQERGTFELSRPNCTRTEALSAILAELEMIASGSQADAKFQ